ncbi:glutathione-dependent formaldehyde-activating enzyme [Phialemonium atrogriseum]|uniref:Glutathione-dependent formaldehyde-activating enzyme n=1 Tax=Phialemonium atrogriseum TaxID=1093897 RepID=A0AAJ0BS23_9PEZI|nr:glutathione-dependent formaldehyde-activating enzyme [Phialemonium atrogriseum]KAK1762333.1 glutathione-dependent formaldehyde-activating enzyme [Phialemonium atrogriseum]
MASRTGHCNCGKIVVSLNASPSEVMVCHCLNCRRAGGPCSINYICDEKGVSIQDANGCLKDFKDHDTQSGNVITRSFCQGCGSPVCTCSPALPGKLVVKASLFTDIATAREEVFEERKISWV